MNLNQESPKKPYMTAMPGDLISLIFLSAHTVHIPSKLICAQALPEFSAASTSKQGSHL